MSYFFYYFFFFKSFLVRHFWRRNSSAASFPPQAGLEVFLRSGLGFVIHRVAARW